MEESLREELCNRDSQENPRGKEKSRKLFLVDVAEELGGKEEKQR